MTKADGTMDDEDKRRLLLTILIDELSSDTINPIIVVKHARRHRPVSQPCLALAIDDDQCEDNNVRITDYMENVVPFYSADSFRSHFRMMRSTFEARRYLI